MDFVVTGEIQLSTQSVHLTGKKSTQNDESNICIRLDPVFRSWVPIY